MVAIAVLAAWGAYGMTTWGWCLVKGYNITFANWFDPLHPYMWTGNEPELVPAGSVLPTSGAQSSSTSVAAPVESAVQEA
jgi:hypothetical protein